MQRRTFALLFALALFAVGPAAGQASWLRALLGPACDAGCVEAPAGSGPLFVVTGHGWGHGVGMAQYGGYGYAQHGWTYRQIVAHYFTGTTIGAAPVTSVRVLLADGRKAVTISSTPPFKVKDGSGKVRKVLSPSVSFGPGLKVQLAPGAKPQALTAPLTFTAGADPLTFRRPYRGALQVDLNDAGKLRVINVVGLQKYLYGVVPSEMPSGWLPEALKAQAVVARSYALAQRKTGGPFDLYPDTRSQMYLGVDHEQPSTNAAVDATAGQVVLYGGAVASTFFYSSSGGRTANAADVWGTAVPYLVSVPDPYDTISPYHNWGPYPFTAASLAKALHVPILAAADAQTTLDSSGRVQTLSLVGAGGTQTDVPASTVRSALGLRSTWFTVGMLSLLAPAKTALEYGSTLMLTGIDRGVAQVSLEQRPAGGTWTPIGPVIPAKDGTVALTQSPAVTTDYRLATATVAAAPVHIAVAPRVRFYEPPQPGDLRGLVRPVLAGAPVAVQRLASDGKTWATVASSSVDANGDFDAQLQLTEGTYRAVVAAFNGYAAGTTPVLNVVGG